MGHGLSKTRRLGHTHVARDDGVEKQSGEVLAQFVLDVGRQARAPVVLLHDSLGCIAVWRDFPERLAVATGREIIAYDRLGFGQSDPHPHRLSGDFIHAEARDGYCCRTQTDVQ